MDKAKFSRDSRIATHSTKVTERTNERERAKVVRHAPPKVPGRVARVMGNFHLLPQKPKERWVTVPLSHSIDDDDSAPTRSWNVCFDNKPSGSDKRTCAPGMRNNRVHLVGRCLHSRKRVSPPASTSRKEVEDTVPS